MSRKQQRERFTQQFREAAVSILCACDGELDAAVLCESINSKLNMKMSLSEVLERMRAPVKDKLVSVRRQTITEEGKRPHVFFQITHKGRQHEY